MICKIILLGLAGLTLAGEPDVFQNYFDDTIKEVDIPLDAAIKACLQNGNTFADKVKNAYADCFGSADYDFGDLAAQEGSKDSDNDGLPDSFENNEQCFYKKMGWVNGAGDLSPDAIKGDLAGLESGTKSEFDGNIDKCAGWNGDFGSRRKREAGETETEEEASNVPSVMESGSSALGWLKAAVRKTRSAEPGNGKKKSRKKGGKGGRKGGNRPKKRGNKTKKGRRNGNGKRNAKAKKNKGKASKKRRKKAKGQNGGRRNSKRNRANKRRKNKNRKKGNKGRPKRKNKGKTNRSGNKDRKRKRKNKGSTNRSGKRDRKRKGKNKNTNQRKGNKGKRNGKKSSSKKGGKKSGQSNQRKKGSDKKEGRNNVMADSTYNKLWCFDLSLEQVLEKCVENKIKN